MNHIEDLLGLWLLGPETTDALMLLNRLGKKIAMVQCVSNFKENNKTLNQLLRSGIEMFLGIAKKELMISQSNYKRSNIKTALRRITNLKLCYNQK
jgi:hypothetical protein